MFKSLSIRTKLFGGFFSIVVIIGILLASAYSSLGKLSEANFLDRHTIQLLREGDGIMEHSLGIQAEYRGFLLTGNERYLSQLKDDEEEITQHLQRAKTLSVDDPVQLDRVKKLEGIVKNWVNEVAHPIIEKRRGLGNGPTSADQMARDPLLAAGFKYVAEIRATLDSFIEEENKHLVERMKKSAELQQMMQTLLIAGGLGSIVFAGAIAFFLSRLILKPLANLTNTVNDIANGHQSARAEVLSNDELGKVTQEFNHMAQAIQDTQAREQALTDELRHKVDTLMEVASRAAAGDLTGKITVSGNDAIGQLGNGLETMLEKLRSLLSKIQKAGIQVASSTTEIAASARQQEATGIEQAQTSVEILSTTKEISFNASQLLKTMGDASQVVELTTAASVDAQANLRRMDQTMQHMVTAAESINGKLAVLSEKASNINNVLVTITKVADQTNILSLNAAIEAEKAGEAGRGFSVVASEIRRLADQTSVATWDIEQMVKEMLSAVSASVMGMDKFSEEIRRSVSEVTEVSEHLATVIEQVQQLPRQFEMVFDGMQSQSVGATQISETMTQLNDASQQTVESLKATSEAVQQLQSAAQELQTSVSLFTVTA
jgi:methyl-accepting chemotaxis protein WspA